MNKLKFSVLGAGAGGQEKRKIPVCPEKTEKEEKFE